jgi:acyl-CoA reductase-like NAD-dependent aldehyde dehydrogenase
VGTGHPADKTHIQITTGAFTRREEDTSAKLPTTKQRKPLHEAKEKILGHTHVFEYYVAKVRIRECGQKKPIGICRTIAPWNMPTITFG